MNATVQNHLRAGELNEAVAVMNAEVRQHPTDINRRATLAELLCFAGNLDRADSILDSINALDPGAGIGVALFRQLVRGEQARQQFFTEGRLPEFLKRPDGAMELELRASIAIREGNTREAAELLAQAEAQRPIVAGTMNGAHFDDFRDLDDLSAAHFEVLTSTGKYYWVPVASVTTLEFRAPERRRDLLWRRALMTVTGGPDGEVFMPAIYGSRAKEIETVHRLGHTTDFVGGDGGPTLALGLRSFLVGDDSRTIHELGTLQFATVGT
jgi:type VI secretion system protein ImpE